MFKKKITQKAFQAKFNGPGSYQWSVDSWAPQPTGGLQPAISNSERRTFTLTTTKAPRELASDLVSDLLLTKHAGVLYLEEGF